MRQAERGEDVAITCHGNAAAYLHPAAERLRRQPSRERITETAARAKSRPLEENAIDIFRRMRDREWD